MQHNSNQLLDKLYRQTSSFMDEAVQRWQMMPAQQFSLQPPPAQWSAKQCLAHLNSYGDYYLPAIEAAIRKARQKKKKVSTVFTTGWLGDYFTKMMQADSNGEPLKKIKAFKKYVHSNNEEGDKVIAVFIDQQEKMMELLEAAREVDLNTTRAGISLAPIIQLQLGDIFMFITAHNHRHLCQAKRAAGIYSNDC